MINIAIDGPAGAGKSTIAKLLSKKLGIIYLDTGAMYRTVALKAVKSGIDTKDADALSEMVKDINIEIKFDQDGQRIFLDNEDVTDQIRTKEISIASSDVAVVPAVRLKMVELQRRIASQNSVVMDGRDIGTYVLPNADFKFFLTASLEERANRRFSEMREKNPDITFEEVYKDIEYRDKNDSSRQFAPLKKAEDAIEIDTTKMTIDEVVNRITGVISNELLRQDR